MLEAAKKKLLAKVWGQSDKVASMLQLQPGKHVSHDVFKKGLQNCAAQLSQREIQALVQLADPQKRGVVESSQFLREIDKKQLPAAPRETDPFILERNTKPQSQQSSQPEGRIVEQSSAVRADPRADHTVREQQEQEPHQPEHQATVHETRKPFDESTAHRQEQDGGYQQEPMTQYEEAIQIATAPAIVQPQSPQPWAAAGSRAKRDTTLASNQTSDGAVEARVLTAANNKPSRLRATFRNFDSTGSGTVTPADFKQALKKIGVVLSAPEIARLIAKTGSIQQGNINYLKMTEAFQQGVDNQALNSAGLPQHMQPAYKRPGSEVVPPWGEYKVDPQLYERDATNRSLSAPAGRGRAEASQSSADQVGPTVPKKSAKVLPLELRNSLVTSVRGNAHIFDRAFELVDPDKRGVVTATQFRRALNAASGGNMPTWAVESALVMADTGKGQVNYGRMLRQLQLADHVPLSAEQAKQQAEGKSNARPVPSSGDIIANRDKDDFEYEMHPSKASTTDHTAATGSGDIICNVEAVRTKPVDWDVKGRVASTVAGQEHATQVDAYRTSGDIIAHRDAEAYPDADVLRWNSNRKCSAVGRRRKPRPTRDPRQVVATEPVDDKQKGIAAQLMRKVHGKKNRLFEVLLDNDPQGDGSVTHDQLRDGVKNLGLQESQCDVLLQEYDKKGTGRVNVRQLCTQLASVDNTNPAVFEGGTGTPRQRQPFTPRSRDVISHSDEPMLRGASPAFNRYVDQDPLNRTTPAAGRSVSAPRARPLASENIIHWGAGMRGGESQPTPAAKAVVARPDTPVVASTPQRADPPQPKAAIPASCKKLPPKAPLGETNTNILAMRQKPGQFVQQSSLTSHLM